MKYEHHMGMRWLYYTSKVDILPSNIVWNFPFKGFKK